MTSKRDQEAIEREDRKLSQSKVQHHLHYKPDTGEFIWKVPTSTTHRTAGLLAGNKGSKGHVVIQVFKQRHRADRLAYMYMLGRWPTGTVKHLDGDNGNCAWSNLQEVDEDENEIAIDTSPANKSGVTGVSWCTSRNRWQAVISVHGVQLHLGHYKEKIDAVRARVAGEKEYKPNRPGITPAENYLNVHTKRYIAAITLLK